MKKLFPSSTFLRMPLCAAVLSITCLSSLAQVAQTTPPAQDAQDLKAAQGPDSPLVPPELQKLVETFLVAFKSGDEAAMAACWHSPQALGAAAEPAASSPNAAPDRKLQVQRNANDAVESNLRAAQMRTALNQFGGVAALKLLRVELGRSAAANGEETPYDGVKLHFLAAGNTHLMISIDDVVKINGAWKFRGSLKDELTIVLPALP